MTVEILTEAVLPLFGDVRMFAVGCEVLVLSISSGPNARTPHGGDRRWIGIEYE